MLAFNQANMAIDSRAVYLYGQKPSSMTMMAGMGVNATTETVSIPFAVDASMSKMWLSVVHTGGNSGASLSLRSPGPNPTTHTATPENDGAGNVTLLFNIDNPRTGIWELTGTCLPETRITYFGDTQASGDTYTVSLETLDEPDNFDNVLVTAHVAHGGADIEGARVVARLEMDNEVLDTQALTALGAGMYTGRLQLDHARSGFARIVVTADNLATMQAVKT